MTATDTLKQQLPKLLTGAQDNPAERRDPRAFSLLLITSAVVAAASTLLAILAGLGQADVVPNGVRVAVVVAAVTLLPGAPIAILLGLRRVSLLGAVTVSISFSTTLVVAQLEVVTRSFSPVTVQLYLCAVSACLIVWASHVLRPAPRSVVAPTRQRLLLLGALVLAVVLFYVATTMLDPQASAATGIIAHVGIAYVAALALVAFVLAKSLTSRHLDPVVLSAAALALIMFTTMYVAFADGITSIPTAYVHRGLIDIIASLQHLPPPSDARFSWAGFFSAGAHMSGAGAIDDMSPMLLWAPLFFGGLVMLPLYSIALSLTGRRRVSWIAIVLYIAFNWYQQDYYAPQPTATMLYLTICAVLLWQLQVSPAPSLGKGWRQWILTLPRRTLGRAPGFGPRRTLAVEFALVLMLAAIVITHQLTPLVVIAALFLFSLTGATRYRLLWLFAAAIFVGWFSYGAVDYWKGHLASVLSDVGEVSGAVQGGVSDRIGADPLYQKMQYLRLAASGGLLMFGFAGWLTYRKRRTWLMGGLLSMVPFGLVVVQSYGGEVVIRCFVLASPFVAPYAADAMVRMFAFVRARLHVTPKPQHWTRIAAVTAAILGIALILTGTRGLNTSFEHTDGDQVAYGDELMRAVPSGASIMVIGTSPNLVSARFFSDVTVTSIASFDCLDDLDQCVRDEDPDFVYTTRQSSAQLYLQYGYSRTLVEEQLGLLRDVGEYRTVVETEDLTVLQKSTEAPVALP